MTTFLLISGAMIAVAILLFAPTLLRARREAAEDTREYNIRIARERLSDLEKEHAKGELSEEEFTQARQDLEIALAQDLTTASSNVIHTDKLGTARMTLVLVAVALPVLVYVIYQAVGSPQHLAIAGPGEPRTATAHGEQQLPSIGEMVGELQRRLEEKPDNPEGWFLLGRTYMKLERYGDAVKAYSRLNEILPGQPNVLIALVDAMSMHNDGEVPDEGIPLLETALELEPESVSALWLAGNAAAQREQDQKALDYWRRAFPLLEGEDGAQQQLRGLMAHVASRSGLEANIPEPLPEIMAQPQQATQPAAPETPAAPLDGLQIEVALDAELLEKAAPGDTVFVYAKASAGPPMPLAVARKRVSDLPVRVALNDSMAMMPQMKLSNFDRVLVGARISKSGQAMPQSGDLHSTEVETASDSEDVVQLLINQQRP